MKLRLKLKTTMSHSIRLGLAFTLSFSPSLYAADQASAPVTTDDKTQKVAPTKQLTAVEWALNGTAETQSRNFQVALKLLAQNKPEDAKKYLLNGISASSMANFLTSDINAQVFGAVKSNPKWMADAGLTTSKIDEAIAQSSQQLPVFKDAAPTTTNPATIDYPGIFATPNISGVYSGDEQIQKLSALMNTNPDLRTLLWQTAQTRLMDVAAPDLGVNPPSYLPGTSILPSSAMCNLYSPLCAFMSGGGILSVDFSQDMQYLKDQHYGVPLDQLANQIITKQTYIGTGLGMVTRLLKDLPTTTGPVSGTWIGQTAVDISPSLALYYTTYMMVGQLAGLYNYPLNTGNKESLALVALALARVVTPTIYYGKKNKKGGGGGAPGQQAMKDPMVKLVAKALVYARTHNQSIDKVLTKMGQKHPNVLQSLRESMKTYGVPIPNVKVSDEHASKKPANNLVDPNNPNGNLFPDGPVVPPQQPVGDFPPQDPTNPTNPTDPTKPPEDPSLSKKSVAVQIGLILLSTLKNTTYNYLEAETVGQVTKALFKNAYDESRRLESENFKNFLLSSANTKFLKLLVLSQSPDSLQLSPVNAPSTSPIVFPTTPNPTTPVTTPGTPVATKPTTTPTGPTNPTGTPANPNPQYFPFAAMGTVPATGTSNAKSANRMRFGGEPYKFILNLARNMKICSIKNVEDADAAISVVTDLIKKHPELSKFDNWNESPQDSQPGIISAAFQPVAHLIPFYKNSALKENLYDALHAHTINQKDVENILLLHDCYGRPDTDRFTDLLNEMISFSNFSDSDIGILRMVPPYSRLRMGETILQLMYLNGEPNEQSIRYFDKVLKILALDNKAYVAYFGFYEAELKKAMYVPYTFSPTGYRLRSLHATNPYDVTVMDEKRPDEPQAMAPVLHSAPNNTNGINSWGSISPSSNDPFQPSGANQTPFDYSQPRP